MSFSKTIKYSLEFVGRGTLCECLLYEIRIRIQVKHSFLLWLSSEGVLFAESVLVLESNDKIV